jgi:filamentous hemagglutinin family protein
MLNTKNTVYSFIKLVGSSLGYSWVVLSCAWNCCVAQAQVTSDGSLSTTVNSADGQNFVIEAGDRRGNNLFHSFREFSVPTGGAAAFNNAADVQNIFSRVTGNSVSNIDGLVRSNGGANLFLLNPNGIVFGAGAKLDIGGSFVGSTANGLRFSDGTVFSAVNPSGNSLLTVSVPIGLQFGQNPAPIRINNIPSNGLPDLQNLGLQVQAGQSLVLAGGNVALNGGRIAIVGGHLELAGLAEAGEIGLSQTGNIVQLDPANLRRANLSLTNGSFIFASAPDPTPSIVIQARNIKLAQGSTVVSGVAVGLPVGFRAGAMQINATHDMTLRNGNIYSLVELGATGNAGNISLSARTLFLTGGARISASTLGVGFAGNVNVAADQITIDGTGSRLLEGTATGIYTYLLPTGVGDAGDINIRTRNLSLVNGGLVSGSTDGKGNGGNVNVSATTAIAVEGVTPGFVGIASGIFSSVEEFSVGDGGNVTLTTPLLSLSQGGAISGRAIGRGNGGNVTVNVDVLAARFGGQVSTTSQGIGNAGNVRINARDRILLTGRDETYDTRVGLVGSFSAFGGSSSGIYANTLRNASGEGGGIRINTRELTLLDGGTLSVDGGGGGAGNLQVSAEQILLSRSRLTAEVSSGDSGNINIAADRLFLRQGSQVTTTAAGSASGGDLAIDADFLLGFENSDIIARAQQGRGGNINIAAQSVLGLTPRSELTSDSDINASSQLGVNGSVAISTPSIDANSGLIVLPSEVADSSQQIANRCASADDNRFVITGRGGLPASPEMVRDDRPWSDLRDLSALGGQSAVNLPSPSAIREAGAWQVNEAGKVELVAIGNRSIEASTCSQAD